MFVGGTPGAMGQDCASIGSPAIFSDIMHECTYLLGFASTHWEQVDLCCAVAIPQKGQRASIGRPAWCRIEVFATRNLPGSLRSSPATAHKPDGAAGCVCFAIALQHSKGDQRAVWRNLWIIHNMQCQEILNACIGQSRCYRSDWLSHNRRGRR